MAKSEIRGYYVNTAVGKRYDKNLYHRALVTAGFMQCMPLFYREVIPFESVHGAYQIWSRLNPMPTPCMGIVDYHYSKFFVRYRDLWPAWNDFYNRTVHYGSGVEWQATESPFFTMKQMYGLLLDNEFIRASSSENYDFSYVNDGNDLYYVWTDKGLPVFKLLTQLGIELSWVDVDPKHYSLLPIYAFGKIYIDHYFPRSYYNNSLVANIQRMFNYDVPASMSMAAEVVKTGVRSIFDLIQSVFYDNNGLYQAWDNPESPGFQTTMPTFNDYLTGNDVGPIGGSGSTPGYDLNGADNPNTLSQLGLKALERIANMMKRYQISGSRYIERFLARFGFKIRDTHTSVKLGTDVINVRIGDVESNADGSVTIGADTFTSVVGDLAGKGVATNNAKIDYENGLDYGIIIGVFSIVPDAGLYQGLDMCNLHTLPEDYYTPEYDQLGVSAVPRHAVFVSSEGADNASQIELDSPFGFLPRGYENCISRNILGGAFRLKRLGAEQLSAYHMYRDLSGYYDPDSVVHGISFMKALDNKQYNRIFYNSKYTEQFIIRFRAQFVSNSFKKSLSEPYDFGEDSGNKKVLFDSNSVTTN